jgi:hypothetical protein
MGSSTGVLTSTSAMETAMTVRSIRKPAFRNLGRVIALCACVLSTAAAAQANDDDWTVVTLARNGAWGAATEMSITRAIAVAVADCKAMSADATDCGAMRTTIRGGWTVALLCGEHKIIAAEAELADAETAAMNREIHLHLHFGAEVPRCKRIVTIDPEGVIVTPDAQSALAR